LAQTAPTEISLYSDELTARGVMENVARIKRAFPQLKDGFYEILSDMIKKDGFTDQRLADAVDNVIRNCIYPEPTLAQFLSWDKKRRVISFEEAADLAYKAGRNITDLFEQIELPNYKRKMWVDK
jgi:hypothetical protein